MNTSVKLNKTEISMVSINQDICDQCGICVEICPMYTLSQNEVLGFPEITKEKETSCLKCGHCVAVCPTGALHHQALSLNDFDKIKKELLPESTQIDQLMRSRRSIRRFKQKPVEKEKILSILNTTRYAPTGANTQAVEWIIINNENTLKKVKTLLVEWMQKSIQKKHALSEKFEQILDKIDSGEDPILREAPAVIIAKAGDSIYPPTKSQDVDIALSYFEISALAHGLGTCWVNALVGGLQSYEPLREELGVNASPYYALLLGYPKYSYKRYPKRKEVNAVFK